MDAVKVEKAVLEKVDIFIENLQVQFVPNMVKGILVVSEK